MTEYDGSVTSATMIPDFSSEAQLGGRVAGVDEVGRGPLAGPVVAAAVILDPHDLPMGLDDSKRLSAQRRAELFSILNTKAEIGIGSASVMEIDRLNIHHASLLAMRRAIAAFADPPAHALIDGRFAPDALACPAQTLKQGDRRAMSIAAASIVAKQTRDALMQHLAEDYPGYGWETNMGYPTKAHRQALQKLGVTPHHRRSFHGVYNIL